MCTILSSISISFLEKKRHEKMDKAELEYLDYLLYKLKCKVINDKPENAETIRHALRRIEEYRKEELEK